MTLTEIKNLTLTDFTKRNAEVWEAIENLSCEEVDSLYGHWQDAIIDGCLVEIATEKAKDIIEEEVINKLTPRQKELIRSYVALDQDILWDNFKNWNLTF